MAYLEFATSLIVIVAVWLVSNKDVKGQYLMAFSQVLWLVVGAYQGMPGLALQSLVLLLIAIRAIRLWSKG